MNSGSKLVFGLTGLMTLAAWGYHRNQHENLLEAQSLINSDLPVARMEVSSLNDQYIDRWNDRNGFDVEMSLQGCFDFAREIILENSSLLGGKQATVACYDESGAKRLDLDTFDLVHDAWDRDVIHMQEYDADGEVIKEFVSPNL